MCHASPHCFRYRFLLISYSLSAAKLDKMAMMPRLLPILLSLLVCPFPTTPTPITLPLIPHQTSTPSAFLSTLALSSLHRAHRLRHPSSSNSSSSSSSPTAPLSSHSYGGYSLSLGFGTPPQPLPVLLDTGSSLPWLPCTRSYLCRNCPLPPTFIPKLSLSSRLVGCLNPKCSLVHHHPACPGCSTSPANNCSTLCPPYFVLYGKGSTAGILLSESLSLSGRIFPDLAVGCSLVSDSQPSGGVAGFGRGPASLPAQLKLARFSYCLVSRRYDDDGKVFGSLVLDGEKLDSTNGFRFTPFIKNPALNGVFSEYYYIGLNRISVGGQKVKIPGEIFEIDGDGNGGAIVDSGTTFTYLEKRAFEPLFDAFMGQVKFRRDPAAEERNGLRPCFELPGGGGEVTLPEMVLHFKGGAEMKLPLENYVAVVGDQAPAVCLTVVTDSGGAGPSGPSVILGSFQQQNFNVVYDLEKGKLGFRKESSCVRT